MLESARVARPSRVRPLYLAMALGLAALALAVLGGIFIVTSAGSAAPTFPPAPPGAHRLWASQTTDMLEDNQIVSVALYRVPGTPARAIAFYRRQLAAETDVAARFGGEIRNPAASALPSTLQHLPRVFVTGDGTAPRADYTYAAYSRGGSDVAFAVDLRHPRGPTLVFVEMLSG